MTPADVGYRRAFPGDAEAIASAHIDSIRSVGPSFYRPQIVADWSAGLTPALYERAMERGEAFFVATGQLNGEAAVMGFATHRVDDGQHGVSVYVRGSVTRRGIGSALLALAEEDARAHGATSIGLEASLAAVEFYRANGFEEVGRGEVALASGGAIRCVFMHKLLKI